MSFTLNLENTMNYLHKQGAFLTTRNDKTTNTMTISWGNIGFEWNRPIFTILVRKSRYTHEIIDKSQEFSVSVPFNDNFKKALALCGSKSGRDLDKITESGLTLREGQVIATPSIVGCEMVYECKVVYQQDMDPNLLSKSIKDSAYKNDDYHTIYYGEILNIISNDENI